LNSFLLHSNGGVGRARAAFSDYYLWSVHRTMGHQKPIIRRPVKGNSIAAAWKRGHMQDNDSPWRSRRRSKQTLQSPRHLDRNVEEELKKMIWVTVGKTEHQAWLVEDAKENHTALIRWESTGWEERVAALSIRHEAPEDGRRSRRKRVLIQDTTSFESEGGKETTIQLPRKRRKRQTKKRVSKSKEFVAPKELESGGARCESKRLTVLGSNSSHLNVHASPFAKDRLDAIIPNQERKIPKIKANVGVNGCDAASKSEPRATVESNLPNEHQTKSKLAVGDWNVTYPPAQAADTTESAKAVESSIEGNFLVANDDTTSELQEDGFWI